MIRYALIALAIILLAGIAYSIKITRNGKRVTPQGEGTLELEAGTFEAFPLPAYAQRFVTEDYKSYFIEVEPGIKVHMLEVGEGYPVLMLHGNPSSPFLYRKIVAELPTDRMRIIMPTLVGLGFSSKVPVPEHTVANHNRWINEALKRFNLGGLIFVGQDWGGIIGTGAMSLSPNMLEGIVMMNSGIFAPEEKISISRIHKIAKTPILGDFLIENYTTAFAGMDRVQGDPASISDDLKELYGRPVLESGNAKAPLAMMRMVPDGPDHPSTPVMREIKAYARSLDVPVEIVWGINDPIGGQRAGAMHENFPHANVIETEAGHFLQEEVPDVIAEAVMRVFTQVREGKAVGTADSSQAAD